MSTAKPAPRLPRWLIPVTGFIAVLAVVSGFAVRQWYAPDQLGQDTKERTTASNSAASGHDVSVELSPDANDHPLAAQVKSLLQAYFESINSGNYDAWRNLVTMASAAQNPQAGWAEAYATSRDSDIKVYRINATTSDGVVVLLSFTSRQDLAHAPTQAPATCDQWRLALPLQRERNALKVDLSGVNSTPEVQACS